MKLSNLARQQNLSPLIAEVRENAFELERFKSTVEEDLARLSLLVHRLSERDFRDQCSTRCGSLGAQLRHSLDHLNALLLGPENEGIIDYQDRVRGTVSEGCPRATLRRIDGLSIRLENFSMKEWRTPIFVRQRLKCEKGERPLLLPSSWAREFCFVLSHMTHHMAIIALLAEIRGYAVEKNFGLATSTQEFRQSQ